METNILLSLFPISLMAWYAIRQKTEELFLVQLETIFWNKEHMRKGLFYAVWVSCIVVSIHKLHLNSHTDNILARYVPAQAEDFFSKLNYQVIEDHRLEVKWIPWQENKSSMFYPQRGWFFDPLGSLEAFHIFDIIFLSSIVFFILFIGILYMQLREDFYLYYLGYLVITFCYFLRMFCYGYSETLSYYILKPGYKGENFLSAGIIMGYIYFLYHFLELHKQSDPKIKNIFKIAVMVSLLVGVGDLLIGGLQDKNLVMLEAPFKIFILSFLSYGFYLCWRKGRTRIVSLILIGSFFVGVGSIMTGFVGLIDINTGMALPVSTKNFYYKFGTFLEILFFTVALAYKAKDIQMEAFESIQHKQKLENQLFKSQLKAINSHLKALRTQLNPHMLLNSLTAAKYAIQKEEYDKAIKYISQFSHFFREILILSEASSIPLSKELAFCRKYLELEAERLKGRFHFQIIEKTDTSYITIAPLSLQPLLENAIKYGLNEDPRKSQIIITVEEKEEQPVLIIEDFGVGFASTKKHSVKYDSQEEKKSLGISLAKKLLNTSGASLQMIDKSNLEPKGQGTIVKIKF